MPDEWDDLETYEVLETIAKGSTSIVKHCRHRRTKEYVAIKKLESFRQESLACEHAMREAWILEELSHPSVIAFRDYVLFERGSSHSSLFLVLEYAPRTLLDFIENGINEEEQVRFLLYQLLEGVRYLHASCVLHRDLTPENILIGEDGWSLKIADLGLARVVPQSFIVGPTQRKKSSPALIINEEEKKGEEKEAGEGKEEEEDGGEGKEEIILTNNVVTRYYRAPEVELLQPYNSSLDMWSVGCIFAELLWSVPAHRISPQRFFELPAAYKLFPGDECGLLNCTGHNSESWLKYERERTLDDKIRLLHRSLDDRFSLLNIIFDRVGTPTKDEIQWMESWARKLIASTPPRPKTALADLFMFTTDTAILELLQSMLIFNPSERICAADALDSELFRRKPMRMPQREFKMFVESISDEEFAEPQPLTMDDLASYQEEFLDQMEQLSFHATNGM